MNYEKQYFALCYSRQKLNRQWTKPGTANRIYYELHHIVPRHEAGSNDASNLVLLTAREHFIAHWLFAKWKRTSKAYCALASMAWNNKEQRKLNSKQFEICRKANSYEISEETRTKMSLANSKPRQPLSYEHKAKLSISKQGENNPQFGKTGKESVNFGRKASSAAKAKISESNKGKIAWNKGLKESDSANLARRKSYGIKRHYRLSKYCPIAMKHKENGIVVLLDSQGMLDFCVKFKIELGNLEHVLKGNRKSARGWIINA